MQVGTNFDYSGLHFVSFARSFFMGPTGFDSSKVGEVSMSGVGMIIRNQMFQLLQGESNFALAA